MSKQIKKIKNTLIKKYIKLTRTSNKLDKGQMSLLVGISQLHH